MNSQTYQELILEKEISGAVKIYLELEAVPSNRILLLHTHRGSLRVGFGLEILLVSKEQCYMKESNLIVLLKMYGRRLSMGLVGP